jgi:hypothetical protein
MKQNKIDSFVRSTIDATKLKQFSIVDIETTVKMMFTSLDEYFDAGGYSLFHDVIQNLYQKSVIEPIKSKMKQTNGRSPILPIYWRKITTQMVPSWTTSQMMGVADLLNLRHYEIHTYKQTDKEWQRIKTVYHFLKVRQQRLWISREERSLELFDDEKFLSSSEGRGLLSQLKITLDDLKAKVFGEPFTYWTRPRTDLKDVKNILIVENLSFFHSCRKILETYNAIYTIPIDMLIYGEGNHIESSIPFLDDIFQHRHYHLYYVGDIDPVGLAIYYRTKNKYDYPLQLALPIYKKLVDYGEPRPVETKQNQNARILQFVYDEINELGEFELVQHIKRLWDEGKRIPQEFLNYEIMVREKSNE